MDNKIKIADNTNNQKLQAVENAASSEKGSHHSHHHSHRHSSKKRKKKVNKKLVWTLIAIMFILLVIFVFIAERKISLKPEDANQSSGTESEILTVEVINPEAVLVKNAVLKYVSADILNSYNTNIRPSDYSESDGRFDMQIPVSLKLSTKDASALMYKIETALNDAFENADVSYLEGPSGTYDFMHLYTNTEYYYRVTVYTNSRSEVLTGRFKTADTPRILSVDGVSNVRDIGNWKTDSGKRIKQGLLIRGTEIDGAVESIYHITNDGIMDMLGVYGIKTEMDLRGQSQLSSDALGARVEHTYYNMVMYDSIFTDEGKEKMRRIFADLADPENYPVYMHCTYGCDRTGTVCYILEAMLGVSKGDCMKEYGLSNLYVANILTVENGLKEYHGNTLKEQAEAYLLSCGVSQFQIQSIRDIFLGE